MRPKTTARMMSVKAIENPTNIPINRDGNNGRAGFLKDVGGDAGDAVLRPVESSNPSLGA